MTGKGVSIYYFSGTGNSYKVADAIARGLQGRRIPMASLIGEGEIRPDSDIVGIVFPVYYADVPVIIREFVPRLTGLASKYLFMVCTYGGGQGRAGATVKRLLRERGGRLSASYGIHLPQNAFFKSWDNPEKLYARAEDFIRKICRNTTAEKKGAWATEPVLDLALRPLTPYFKSLFRKSLIKMLGADKDIADTALIHEMDRTVTVDESCTGCGICASVCPVGNIVMRDGSPQWNHRCENCLACYNFCSQKSIRARFVHKDYYYLHPDYSLKDARSQIVREKAE